jgi:hypothetical protein
MRTWFTVTQPTEYAGVCRGTIYSARRRREVCHPQFGGRRTICLKLNSSGACMQRHAVNAHDRCIVGRNGVSEDGRSEARS